MEFHIPRRIPMEGERLYQNFLKSDGYTDELFATIALGEHFEKRSRSIYPRMTTNKTKPYTKLTNQQKIRIGVNQSHIFAIFYSMGECNCILKIQSNIDCRAKIGEFRGNVLLNINVKKGDNTFEFIINHVNEQHCEIWFDRGVEVLISGEIV